MLPRLRRRGVEGAFLVLSAGWGLLGCTRGLPDAGPGSPEVEVAQAVAPVKLDHFGYRPDDPKVAIFTSDPGSTVQVRTAAGAAVFAVPADGGSISGRGIDAGSGDHVWWVDFSPLRIPGTYGLTVASPPVRSYEFAVAPDVYRRVLRTALRTFYLQRCGVAKANAYAGVWADGVACHRTDTSTSPAAGQADAGLRDLSGGWHDAGDYNKYVWYAVSNAVLFLLGAWEDNRPAFPDGDLGIPESGNGVPDLLDEAKWELDFLLKMQLADGSVLSRVHAEGSDSGGSPPSTDTTRRYYLGPTLESGAVLAGSCALGARVFAAAGLTAYAVTLRRAALSTWTWLQGQGDSDEKVWAAAEVFRLDPEIVSARAYVDGYHAANWAGAALGATSYDTHAALTYVRTARATPAVASAMKVGIGRQVEDVFSTDDLYRNGMPAWAHHWGSNGIRAGRGVFLLRAAQVRATGSRTPAECRRHALDVLHYFHGQNPLGMVYLTNMASLGGEHSSWQVFHDWFGQSRSAYSRSRFVGKPLAVVEPGYPYFDGTDNHGIRDDKTSLFGPAPGFVPGGPNWNYSGDAVPPRGSRHPARSYRDWNDQGVWTARTWEITEPSIGYQGPYVALVAAFVEP
jgi:endoglucanase